MGNYGGNVIESGPRLHVHTTDSVWKTEADPACRINSLFCVLQVQAVAQLDLYRPQRLKRPAASGSPRLLSDTHSYKLKTNKMEKKNASDEEKQDHWLTLMARSVCPSKSEIKT